MFETFLLDMVIKIAFERLFHESWPLAIAVIALVLVRFRLLRD